MATIQITLNKANPGQPADDITPDADLTYRVYNDTDSYTTPEIFGSGNADPNVSVSSGVATIINVNEPVSVGGYKVGTVDGNSNESPLSDAYLLPSVYKLVMADAIQYLSAVAGFNLDTAGNYIEANLLYLTSTTSQYLLGHNTGAKALLADTGYYQMFNDAGSAVGNLTGFPPESSHVLGKVKILRNGLDLVGYWDDVLKATITAPAGTFTYGWIGRFSTAEWKAELHDFTLHQNGVTEVFACNEGAGSIITGDKGTEFTIGGYVDDSIWVAI